MDEYAKGNLGYIQTTNTTVEVYKKDNSLFFVDKYYDESTNNFDDYEYIGDICCDVWRIEMMDLEYIPKDYEHDYVTDNIIVEMEAGTYELTDYELPTKETFINGRKVYGVLKLKK